MGFFQKMEKLLGSSTIAADIFHLAICSIFFTIIIMSG